VNWKRYIVSIRLFFGSKLPTLSVEEDMEDMEEGEARIFFRCGEDCDRTAIKLYFSGNTITHSCPVTNP
jgi:hypothetical protein